MKTILFDLMASQPDKNTKFHGGGEYIKTVFLELCKINEKEEFKIITFYNPDLFIDEWIMEAISKNNIKNYKVHSYDEVLKFNEINKIDVFFAGLLTSFQYITLPKHIKVIAVYHGLRILELPIEQYASLYAANWKEYCSVKIKVTFKNRYFIKKREEMKKLLDKCDYLIAVSQHSKYSALAFLPEIDMEKILVFYSPAKHVEDYGNISFNTPQNKTILMLGGNRWTKNIYRGISAIDELASSRQLGNYKIKIIGNVSKQIKKKIKNIDKFEFLGYVSPMELEKNYMECDIFLYPTLNEGFGYPPLEAMRYGKTCIISAVTSLTEIYGDSVYYCNPYDINEIKIRILQAIDQKISTNKIEQQLLTINKRQTEDLDKLCELIVGRDEKKR